MKPKVCGNKSFIHLARKYRFRMKPQTATGKIFIHPGLFGRVRMKPKNCGNKLFIHLARTNRFWMKPQTAAGEIFIHPGKFGEVRMKPQKLWQQVIHPFGQKIQVSDEATLSTVNDYINDHAVCNL